MHHLVYNNIMIDDYMKSSGDYTKRLREVIEEMTESEEFSFSMVRPVIDKIIRKRKR